MKFEVAVLPHRPELRAYAMRFTRSAACADDLLQDTLMLAWQAWDAFEKCTNVRAWLHTIMRNRYCTKYRRQRRDAEAHLGATEQWAVWAQEAADAGARTVGQFLDTVDVDLQPGQVSVLKRYYDQGMRISDLVAAERAPRGTVCTRRFRAERALRDSAAVREYARSEYGLRAVAP